MIRERRKYERLDVSLEARVVVEGDKYDSRILNISLGGCYVETLAKVELRSIIAIELHLLTGEWVLIHGTVIHQYPNIGLGLRFEYSSKAEEEFMTRLIDYIRQNRP